MLGNTYNCQGGSSENLGLLDITNSTCSVFQWDFSCYVFENTSVKKHQGA